MPPQSAVFTSPFRKEIEEMIIEGKSPRQISKWLKEHDEKISYVAIYNYKNNHFNVQEEAVKEHNEKQSRKRKEKGKQKVITTLELCQKFKDEANKRDLSEIDDLDMCRLGLQAGKLEHDHTKEAENKEINFNLNFKPDKELLNDLEALDPKEDRDEG